MTFTTSEYYFLRPIHNAFTFDTNEYYPRCYKVNDAKTFKNAIIIALSYHFTLKGCKSCQLAHLIGAFRNKVDLVLRIIESN